MGHNTDSRYTVQCHPTGQRYVQTIFLEVVCNPGLHSAGTIQWGTAGAEMKEKAAAMRYKVSRMCISLLVLMPKFNAM